MQRGGVGVPKRECLLVVGQRFAVGVQAPRVVPGQQVVPRRLGVLPREPVVAGYLAGEGVRFAAAGLPRERGGGAAVQEKIGKGWSPRERVPKVSWRSRRMGYLRRVRPPGSGPQFRASRAVAFFFAPTAGRPDRVEVEGSSDNGGGGEDLSRRLADRRETGPQEILHPPRQRPGVVFDFQFALLDGREILREKERQPLRLVAEPRAQPPRFGDGVPDQFLDRGGIQPARLGLATTPTSLLGQKSRRR